MLAPGSPTAEEVRGAWGRGGRTFERLHPFLSALRLVGTTGYDRILDAGVREHCCGIEGRAFDVTPLAAAPALAAAIGRSGRLWVKDETGNVTGSHKGRHLMGTLLYLEALQDHRWRLAVGSALAIYSCGNAAFAAAAVARAGGYELHAFVPADVDPLVAGLLAERGAVVEKNPPRRRPGQATPATSPFGRPSAEKGWLPFACAGNDNWSNIEGGSTLGWELVLQLRERSETLEHVVIQVGGGALARAVGAGARGGHGLGLIREAAAHSRLPACGRVPVRARLAPGAGRNRPPQRVSILRSGYDRGADPRVQLAEALAFCPHGRRPDSGDRRIRPAQLRFSRRYNPFLIEMAGEAGRFMWPWDGPAPHSLAHGILDDITYDWFYLLRAVLRTGGRAEILSEDTIGRAHDLARRHTGIRVCPTGAAGLAGLIQLTDAGAIEPRESAGLFFTGFDRAQAG